MTTIKLIGSNPNQVSRNRDLGSLAFQNADSVIVENLTVTDTIYKFGRGVEQFVEFNIPASGTQSLTFSSSIISQSSLVYIDIALSFYGLSGNPANYKSGSFVFRSLCDNANTTVQTAVTTLFSDGIAVPILTNIGSRQFTATITNPLVLEVTAVVCVRTLSNKGILELLK